MNSKNLYRAMLLVFISYFILGGYLLENLGVKYVSEGGNPLMKIHVSTYILILTFAFFTLRKGGFSPLKNLKELRGAWLISVLSIVIVIIYGLFRFGTSGMAYLVDTMAVPLLAVYLLSQLSNIYKNKLLRLLAYLLFINSLIAILEFILGSTLMSVEIANFSHFRSTALLTHPLNNALITAALAPILMSYTRIPYLIYFTVVILALFAFGGRGATGIFLLGMFLLVMPKIPSFISFGIKISKMRFAVIQALAFFVSIFTILVITFTPIGSRILSKLHIDGSAQARFDVFLIFDQLSPMEWVFGASSSLMDNIKFFIEVDVIENYFIGWIVSFGTIGAFLLFVSCYMVPIKLLTKRNMGVNVALIIFIMVSLTNNALTTKTPALIFLFSAMYLYRTIGNKNEALLYR